MADSWYLAGGVHSLATIDAEERHYSVRLLSEYLIFPVELKLS
jgi:hypothetical protein